MKKNYKKQSIHLIVSFIGILILLFAFMFYSLSPATMDFRYSIYGTFFDAAIWFAAAFIIVFKVDSGMPTIGKVVGIIYPVLKLLLNLLQLGRVSYIFLFAYAVLNAVVSVWMYVKGGENYFIWFFSVLSFFPILALTYRTTTVDDSFHFWKISLAIAIIATVVAVIYCVKNASKLRLKGKGESFGVVLCALMFGFLIPWMTISSANIFLDFSQPTYIEATVVDKDVDSGARQITDYQIIVIIDGEQKEVSVSEQDYRYFEDGDTVVLSIYNGAFGVKYYLCEGDAQKR